MTRYMLCCIQRSPPRRQGTGDREPEATDVRRHSALMHDEHHAYYETDRRSSNYGVEPPVWVNVILVMDSGATMLTLFTNPRTLM